MNFKKGMRSLRNLIREHLSVIEEGGHGGRIEYVNVPKLFKLLDGYSSSGSASREKIISFLDSLVRICDSSQLLSAYVGRNDVGRPKAPISKAYSVVERMYNPEVIMQYGEPNPRLVEKQVMDALGASFYSGDDPKTGFIGILGATLGWTAYPDPKTPASMALSKLDAEKGDSTAVGM